MSVCAAGGREIVGTPWRIDDWYDGASVLMCEIHARIVGLGRAMYDQLGEDHPWLADSAPYFKAKSRAPCPEPKAEAEESVELDDEDRADLDRIATGLGLPPVGAV